MRKNLALIAMGVQNPEQIARFATYMVDNTDILRIIYDRKKGSILPVSKKFKFPQIKKSTMVDSGTRRTEVLYESSNEFRNAVSELEQLMDERADSHNVSQLIAEEVRALEEDVASRIDYIKSLVEKI
ncbi:DUF3461 family protein [Candidatus Spongiihabitans sp.]|uniref:DUF3461 family protein n=1 Tax=Candidatus Spongiihabitans sp. TaxID=3101308 RepID=UPI003C6EF57E